ncbi:MAG: phage tail protein [Terriglobia bacterium]|jgi:phage tail-like protein
MANTATGTRIDPYAGFNFRVMIDGITAAGFSECYGLTSETDVIEYREGTDKSNTVRKLPGLNRFSPIILKRGVTADKALWQWRKLVMEGTIQRSNGSIVLLGADGNPVNQWNFTNGWPAKWDGPSFNAKGNAVAIETLEIVHEGLDWA